ncbi:MAG: hypothetical protein C4308_07315 [Chitinophagaceae bacterium]
MPADLFTRIKAIQKNISVAETGQFDLATCIELEKTGNVVVDSTNLITHKSGTKISWRRCGRYCGATNSN